MNFKLVKNSWVLILIVVIFGFLFISHLGRDLFWDWDECLYTVYARDMPRTKNFLINEWNNYNDLQKPPLYTWLLQIPFFFSQNEFSARILSVFFGLGLVVVVYIFSKKYFSSQVAILSSLLLLTSEVFVIYSQKVNTDIGFTFLIFLGFWLFLISNKKSYFSYFSGIAFGLAVMMKGLSVIQFILPLFLSIFFSPTKEKFLNFFKMFAVFGLIIIPWHIRAYLVYRQGFLQIYFYENIIQRAQNPIEFHYGGRLFYVKQLFKEFFPWILTIFILPIFYLFNIKKYLKKTAILKELQKNETILTIALLVMIPFLAITRIQTKLPWYALPLYPFLAIFIAYSIEFLAKKMRQHFIIFVLILIITVDALKLVYTETKFWQSKKVISPRDDVAVQTRKFPHRELSYLVQRSERTAKALLDQSPNLQIKSTFVYGGNPCAVYYSDKKVNYYYSTEEFQQKLKKDRGLYLLENGDSAAIKDFPVKILYQNSQFTLFEKI